MASQDEETKRMMKAVIEQQAEMIKMMKLSIKATMSLPTPPPNPFSIRHSPPPTFRPQPPPTYHPQPSPIFHPRPPPIFHPQPPPTYRPQPAFRPQPPPTFSPQPPLTFRPQPYPFTPQPPQPSHPKPPSPVRPPREKRQFDDLRQPLSKVFMKLERQGILKPLHPIPSSFPANHDPNHFCAYHQSKRHPTDNCWRLRHEIQNLIDQKVIPKPNYHNHTHFDSTNPPLVNPHSTTPSTPKVDHTIPHPTTSTVPEAPNGEYANPTKKRKRL